MPGRVAHIALLLGALILLVDAAQDEALAQESSRAAVVVRFDDQRVESRCVAFDEEEISGYTLLQRSGLSLDFASAAQGGLVCAIEGTGCGVDDCLCQCQGNPCVYWSYWRLGDDGWAYSPVGASVRRVSDGDVDGWSWGPGSVTSAIEPPAMRFDEICTVDAPLFDGAASGPAADVGADAAAWLPYVALGLLLVALGAGTVLASRRRQGS